MQKTLQYKQFYEYRNVALFFLRRHGFRMTCLRGMPAFRV
jgi:hypothetical protein